MYGYIRPAYEDLCKHLLDCLSLHQDFFSDLLKCAFIISIAVVVHVFLDVRFSFVSAFRGNSTEEALVAGSQCFLCYNRLAKHDLEQHCCSSPMRALTSEESRLLSVVISS